jgi:hypothetical protein
MVEGWKDAILVDDEHAGNRRKITPDVTHI